MVPPRSEAIIRGARSFSDFYRAVEQTGNVTGTRRTYTPQEIRNLTEAVRQGEYTPDVLTRADGIRETALRLMGEEAGAKSPTPANLDSVYRKIDSAGPLRGTQRTYTPDELKEIARRAAAGEVSYRAVTRSGGMREAVMQATGDFRGELKKQGYEPDRIFMDMIRNDLPEEGFKLHVTASAGDTRKVIAIVGPLLRGMSVDHKFVGSIDALENVMRGTQVGKFLTVYPKSTQDAVNVARILDEALAGKDINGPRIPNDNPLPDGKSGLVFYRYAANRSDHIIGPNGEPVKDRRDGPAVPAWIKDPFKEQR
ncbi:MAG TPA: hypothetical protein VI933_00150 [archaeon]|nr:hypothetical protein [archaeon]